MSNLKDKDILNVLLTGHKFAASSYTTLVLESANQYLRNDATGILTKTFEHQKQIFDIMAQKGWYQVQNASSQEISNAQQKVSSLNF